MASCVRNKNTADTLKVSEGENDEEYLITRHSQFNIPINIMNIYGEQEGRTTNDEILSRWENMQNEVARIEAKGDHIVMRFQQKYWLNVKR